jgi:type II secretory pathway pseudopilin PulG
VSARIESDEAGATLIELLIAIALSGMLMAALAGAMFTGLRTTRDTTTSLDQSNAEQVITTSVTKDIEAATAAPQISGVSSCDGQPIVLELTSASDALQTSTVTISYRLAGGVLVRQICGQPASTLARNVTSFTASGDKPVSVTVATAATAQVSAYSWTFQVQRRPA